MTAKNKHFIEKIIHSVVSAKNKAKETSYYPNPF